MAEVGPNGWRLLAPAPPEAPPGPPPRPPLFSVVIAAYESAAWLPGAVRSALEQTYAPYEVIVVDDGSTDDPAGALGPLLDRVTFIRRDNGGEGAAKDTGTRAASGDFVALLDADDVYEPRRLEALAWMAGRRPDLDMLLTDAYLERDGIVLGRCYRDVMAFEVRDQRAAILRDNFLLGHLAVRRGRLLHAGGFDPGMRAVADWDLWIRAVLGGAMAGLVDAPLSRYRLRDEGISGDRPRLTRWKVRTLEAALARPGLEPDERAAVGRRLDALRRDAALIEAEDALAAGLPSRARLLRIAADGGQPGAARARAAVGTLAPGVARRVLEGRRRRGVSRLTRTGAGRTARRDAVPAPREAMRLAVAGLALLALRAAPAKVGLAVMYHRVGDADGDRATQIVPAVSSARLRAHLRLLARHLAPVTASALPAAVGARRPGQRIPVAVTFDDDLRSHLTHAAPILRDAGVAATFFLCGASLERPSSFWWERLQAAVDAGAVDVADLHGVAGPGFTVERPGIRGLAAGITRLSPDAREAVERLLEERTRGLALEGGLDSAEASALAAMGFEIGSHTLHHPVLTALDEGALRAELAGAASGLGGLGSPGGPLAYPHGRADSRVAAVARACGHTIAYTGRADAVTSRSDPLLLGRIDAAPLSAGGLAIAAVRALTNGFGAGRPRRGTA